MSQRQIRNVAIPARSSPCWPSCRAGDDTRDVFGGPTNTPGTLQLLALMLVFAGVALTYDLLFGFTGLLSFGHALYFAIGVYVAAIAMTKWHWSFAEAVLLTAAVGFVLPARARLRAASASAGSRSRW